jgi:hypothetical protein
MVRRGTNGFWQQGLYYILYGLCDMIEFNASPCTLFRALDTRIRHHNAFYGGGDTGHLQYLDFL